MVYCYVVIEHRGHSADCLLAVLSEETKARSKVVTMKQRSYANITVFILFFGIALIEALQQQNWLGAFLFLSLGVISLFADIEKV